MFTRPPKVLPSPIFGILALATCCSVFGQTNIESVTTPPARTVQKPPVSAPATDLVRAFRDPPATARPGVYWYFMDGNRTHKGMTADLESMRSAGIGNLVFLEVNVGVPRGPVDFLSPQWQDLFVHGVREAERLGIEITLGSGPGWAGSGGPWVKPAQSMQHLVATSVDVEGPKRLTITLPKPAPRTPYFGARSVPPDLQKLRDSYYEDVAVLAFPTPVGDVRIADIDEKALYYRAPYSSVAGVKPYLPAPAMFPTVAKDAAIARDAIVDLTNRLKADGTLTWETPKGNWTIMRFGRRNNGATTRPAPKPGFGFECDKLSAAALDAHFDAYIGKLIRRVGPREVDNAGWTMLHIDSWEMGAQNWTENFRTEFQRRRGYDPLRYLPTYAGRVVDSLELSERFLWDVRLTAQELVLENHAGHLKELGRKHGFGLSIEPYDMNPTSDLELGSIADVPMCEFWSDGLGFDTSFSCIESVSIAHTQGRPIVAAEAFTANSREAWTRYPATVKNQGDWAFCTGINRFVYHTFAHKPEGRRPGMTMGPYGVHWDRGQTWWPMASAYHQYVTRCQFLLRQGNPVADICYLVPEGAPHVFRPPPSALIANGRMPDRRGYNFDACAPSTLINKATVQDGNVVFPGGAAYRLLVLPSVQTMTPQLLSTIERLVRAGATVIGIPPRKSPSLMNYPDCDRTVEASATRLWGQLRTPDHVTQRRFGSGRIFWGGALSTASPTASDTRTKKQANPCSNLYPDYASTARILESMGVTPDFTSDGPIRYTHRRVGDKELFFVANRTEQVVSTSCLFRVSGGHPELWDPLDSSIRELADFNATAATTTVPLRFGPFQSFFVVFRPATGRARMRTRAEANFADFVSVGTIAGPWQVSFDPNLGGPQQATFATLEDWTHRAEPGIKYYSGIADYRTTFDLPDDPHMRDRPLFLDLGTVWNMAHVRLNDKDLGVVWCYPWHVDITQAVRAKRNRLQIEVANLWPNRLIGDKHLPEAKRITWTTFNPYQADSPLLPSGLIGPVTLKSTETR